MKNFTVLLLLICTLPVFGQKKKIDHTCYDSWNSMSSYLISDDGAYIAYTRKPQKGNTDIFLYDVKKKAMIDTILCASAPEFIGNSHFLYTAHTDFEKLRKLKLAKTKKEKLDRGNYCVERVTLECTNSKYPSEISGGMQKRVGIARAIVNNSKYLFCDEPNSGLDPRTSIQIDQLLEEITDEYQITTVIVTHDMNSVMEIGEYIMFISDSKKLWEGSNTDIMHSGVEALDDFVFANKMMRRFREMG